MCIGIACAQQSHAAGDTAASGTNGTERNNLYVGGFSYGVCGGVHLLAFANTRIEIIMASRRP